LALNAQPKRSNSIIGEIPPELSQLYLLQTLSLDHNLLSGNVHPKPQGLVCKAHRLVYHSTLGWRVMKKKRNPQSMDQP